MSYNSSHHKKSTGFFKSLFTSILIGLAVSIVLALLQPIYLFFKNPTEQFVSYGAYKLNMENIDTFLYIDKDNDHYSPNERLSMGYYDIGDYDGNITFSKTCSMPVSVKHNKYKKMRKVLKEHTLTGYSEEDLPYNKFKFTRASITYRVELTCRTPDTGYEGEQVICEGVYKIPEDGNGRIPATVPYNWGVYTEYFIGDPDMSVKLGYDFEILSVTGFVEAFDR